jgi:sugar phosphate isomerase/epimerase
MNESVTRREFVHDAGRLAAGLGLAALAARRAAAAEPPKRLRVACRDVFLKLAEQKDCWPAMEALGAEGVEATLREDLWLPILVHRGQPYSLATAAGVRQLADDMRAAGRRVTALCTYNRFEERPDLEVEWCTKAARAAAVLGIPCLRIDVVPQKLPIPQFLDACIPHLKKLMDVAEKTGVAFAIENHGHATNDPEFLGPLFERVGSKRLGLTLDTGNFYWFGHPLSRVYELMETYASRIFHTHTKSIRYPADQRERRRPAGWEYAKYTCPIYEGDIDFRRVIKILRAAGYSNDLCVEDESLARAPAEQHRAIFAKELAYLKDLLAQAGAGGV